MRAWEPSLPADLLTYPERLLQTEKGEDKSRGKKNPTTHHPTAVKKSRRGGGGQTALCDSWTEGQQGAESPWLFLLPAADQGLSCATQPG